jgi:hypothetical protein
MESLMRNLCAAAAVVLGISSASNAAGLENVSWSNTVEEAWHTAGLLDRPMIVFVTRTGCLPCARMKTITFVDRQVTGLINDRYVAVTVDGGQPTPFLHDLQVHAVPATFIISPKAVILDRMEGFLSPQALASKLTTMAPQPKPQSPQPSTTARAF